MRSRCCAARSASWKSRVAAKRRTVAPFVSGLSDRKRESMTTDSLPVAVIGAGPVGLAAAAHLLSRGEAPLVLEAGEAAGASIREWGHVRLFSPWRSVVDPA